MKSIAPAIKVGVTVILAVALGYWGFSMLAKGGCAGGEQDFLVHAYFQDATGLVEKSQVQIAGLNVGAIISKELSVEMPRQGQITKKRWQKLIEEKRFAHVVVSLQSDVVLYKNAVVYKKAVSLLGGFYLEIDPGTREGMDRRGRHRTYRRLKSGDEIETVKEAVTTDTLVRQISEVIPVLRNISSDIRKFTEGPLQDISKNIDEAIRENRDSVRSMLVNLDAITGSVRRISDGAEADIDAILDDIRTTTGAIRKIIGRSDKDVQETTDKLKNGLDKLASAIDKLDAVLGDVKGITGDVQEGKGTVGRLLKDETLIENVEQTVSDVGEVVRGVTDLQTIVGLRTEYNFQANSIKTYVIVEIHPRPDKYYLIELIQDPRGHRSVSTVLTRSDDPSKPAVTREEKVEITTAFRFSFQFAKRLAFATFRFGIKENTGGVGIDLHLWKDRVRLESDLFDFSANIWPRLKVLAAWEFFRHLYVVGGIDDAFNDRPLDGTAGGRDYFMGAQIRFNDEDLKTLLLFGGSAIGSASQ